MTDTAAAAKRIAQKLRESNHEENVKPTFHLLTGLLDSISKGRPLVNSDVMFRLVMEASLNHNIPKEVAYEIGLIGFGVLENRVTRSR